MCSHVSCAESTFFCISNWTLLRIGRCVVLPCALYSCEFVLVCMLYTHTKLKWCNHIVFHGRCLRVCVFCVCVCYISVSLFHIPLGLFHSSCDCPSEQYFMATLYVRVLSLGLCLLLCVVQLPSVMLQKQLSQSMHWSGFYSRTVSGEGC